MTVTLLGSNLQTGTSITNVVPITVNQPAGTLVLVCGVSLIQSTTFFAGSSMISFTDTQGGANAGGSPHPNIGAITDGALISGIKDRLTVHALTRNFAAPKLVNGDTLTVTWIDPGLIGASYIFLNAVVAISGVEDHIVTSSDSQYGNGNSFPSSGGSPAVLNWLTDIGDDPTPSDDALLATLVGSYPGANWTPDVGATAIEIVTGGIALALSVASIPGGVPVEPGGTFDAGPAISVANYQFIEKGCPQSIFWFYKDGEWRNQNADPDFSLWFYKDGMWQQDCDTYKGFLTGTWQP